MSPSPQSQDKGLGGEEKPSLVWPGLLRMAGQIPGSASSSVPSCISAARCVCGAVVSGPSRGEPSLSQAFMSRWDWGKEEHTHTRYRSMCPWPVSLTESFPVHSRAYYESRL